MSGQTEEAAPHTLAALVALLRGALWRARTELESARNDEPGNYKEAIRIIDGALSVGCLPRNDAGSTRQEAVRKLAYELWWEQERLDPDDGPPWEEYSERDRQFFDNCIGHILCDPSLVFAALGLDGQLGWQTIDTAPERDGAFLLYAPDADYDEERYFVGHYTDFAPYADKMGEPGRWSFDTDEEPTHWMPLPEPPK